MGFQSNAMCCACGGGKSSQAASDTCTMSTPCSSYENDLCGVYDDEDFQSNVMCCACGGGSTSQATCTSWTCTTPGWTKKFGTRALKNPSEKRCCEAAGGICDNTDNGATDT